MPGALDALLFGVVILLAYRLQVILIQKQKGIAGVLANVVHNGAVCGWCLAHQSNAGLRAVRRIGAYPNPQRESARATVLPLSSLPFRPSGAPSGPCT